MGTVYLLVPKVSKGGYVPFFISERRRSEQALITVVQEAFNNGVLSRKIERLARAMGIENISASKVSEFNKELDALYQKVLVEGRVVSVAVMVGSREAYDLPNDHVWITESLIFASDISRLALLERTSSFSFFAEPFLLADVY